MPSTLVREYPRREPRHTRNMQSRPEEGRSPRVTAWSDVIDAALSGFREAAQRVHEVATETLREVGPMAARFMEQVRDALDEGMAPNWKGMSMRQVADTIELMGDTGWGLAWTPPHDVLVEVLAADSPDSRKAILLGAEPLILIDLRRLVDEVRQPALYEVTRAANEALEVHVCGFYWASKALATNALSTTIQHVYGMGTFKASLGVREHKG